jgi:hypothetical protein
MMLAQEDKPGVGGQVKRLFPEDIIVEVHQKKPLDTSRTSNKKGKNTPIADFFWVKPISNIWNGDS